MSMTISGYFVLIVFSCLGLLRCIELCIFLCRLVLFASTLARLLATTSRHVHCPLSNLRAVSLRQRGGFPDEHVDKTTWSTSQHLVEKLEEDFGLPLERVHPRTGSGRVRSGRVGPDRVAGQPKFSEICLENI